MSTSTCYQEASPTQVQQWLSSGDAILIDVREPEEHAREHITGAQSLPLSRFDPAHAATLVRPGQKLVLHCKGGHRSADAARRCIAQAQAGIPIVSMSGGINAWKGDNLPVEVNTKVFGISIMRQVQMVAGGGVLLGCALAWWVHPYFLGIPAFFGAGLFFSGASGTCPMASLLSLLPWNKAAAGCSK